ncbi:hypothetical protein PT2222_270118 [Paraburkholderia tropica]
MHFVERQEAVFVERAVLADIADADEGHIGLARQPLDDAIEPVIAPLRALGLVVGDQRRGQQEVLAAGLLGDVQRHVVAVRRAVLRDRADHRNEPVLRTVELRDLIDGGLERAPAAHGHDHRPLLGEIALHHLRACHGELAVDRVLGVAVDGHDFAHREAVALREPVGEREAVGQPMIDAHADQVLLDRIGDEPLRDRARDLELFGDLVLGVAGHVVEPRGAGGEIEFFGGLGHGGLRFGAGFCGRVGTWSGGSVFAR